MKKFLSILIAVVLLLSALPMGAVSADETDWVAFYEVTCSEDEEASLNFTPEEDGYYVFYTDCDADTNLCLEGEVDGESVSYWAEDVSDTDFNCRMKVRLNKGVSYHLYVTAWQSDPAAVTLYVERADKYVVSGEIVNEPFINIAIEDAEYFTLFLHGIEIEFTFSDGTKETFVYGVEPTIADRHIDGSPVAYYQEDTEDTVYFFCDEAAVEWKYQVVENPVDYMEYTGDPIKVIEGRGYYDEFEGVYYYEDYNVDEDDTFVVYYKDGSFEEINVLEALNRWDVFGKYPAILSDDQYLIPWVMGGENYAYIYYLGTEVAVPVEIVPDDGSYPDDDITPPDEDDEDIVYPDDEPPYVEEDDFAQGTSAHYTVDLTMDDPWEYLAFTPEEDGYYTIYSTGGYDTFCTLYSWLEEDKWLEYVAYGEDISEGDYNFVIKYYLEAGITYYLEVGAYDEEDAFIDVYVENTDLYVTDIEFVKGPDIDYLIEGQEYDSFNINGTEIECTLNDGSKVPFVFNEVVYDDHIMGAAVIYDLQEIDSVYYIVVTCDDGFAQREIEVIENPVERIEYTGDTLEIEEGTNMYYDEDIEEYVYAYFNFSDDNPLVVYYKDGTKAEININRNLYDEIPPNEYPIYCYDNQYSEPWEVGGEYIITLEYLGLTAQVPVKIVPYEGSDGVTFMVGDANSDEVVNIKDATFIQKAIAELVYMDEIQSEAADTDHNGTVNIKDATAIQKFIAGMDTGLDIGAVVGIVGAFG